MIKGCFTALVTPFSESGVDYEGLEKLVAFQVQEGIDGLLAVGTTGESPTLTWNEHHQVIEFVARKTTESRLKIAGVGSNNTQETLAGAKHATDAGVDAILLVDPYYNGPSSLEIRREYIAPVAEAFPDTQIIPYIIPGRTGAQMFPEDLALLSQAYANVATVKEATGDLNNMRRTRECCGADFSILSGDDALVFEMMTDAAIHAQGVISVASNIVPGLMRRMIDRLDNGDLEQAQRIQSDIAPLFNLVTVKTIEKTPFGEVVCRARNPLAIKTLMMILGMPAGGFRRPLGKMTAKGFAVVLNTARKVHAKNSQTFQPIADFFDVDIDARLGDANAFKDLVYNEY